MSQPPSNNSLDFNRANQLFNNGHFTEALQIVETLEQQKDLSLNEYLSRLILKSTILINLARYEEALKFAESALAASQQQQNHLQIFDALLAKSAALRRIRKLEDCFHTIEQAEQELLFLSQEQSLEILLRKANLLLWKGACYWPKGEFNRALEFLEESLALGEQIGNQLIITEALFHISCCYMHKGDLEQGLIYTQKSLHLSEELDHKLLISNIQNSLGVIYFQKGELDRALEFFQKSLALRKEFEDKLSISIALDNIARVYHMKGDLEQALECGKQSLSLCEQFNYSYQTASALFHLYRMIKKKNSHKSNSSTIRIALKKHFNVLKSSKKRWIYLYPIILPANSSKVHC